MGRSRLVRIGTLALAAGFLTLSCASAPGKAERLDVRMRLDADYARRLAVWPVPYEEKFLPTRYGPTHVILSGPENAPLLVLLHAMGVNSLTWAPNVAELAAHYRVAAIDTIGDAGRSIARRDYPENGKEYADWVADVVAALGAKKASIAGCSMGGWIATCAALYRPEAVDRIILVSPAAGIPLRTKWGALLVSLIFDGSPKNLRKVGRYVLGSGKAGDDWIENFLLSASDPKAGKLGMPSNLSDGDLRRINAPVLLLVGDREPLYTDPAEVADRARRLLRRCETATIPNAGHIGHYDNPGFVDQEMEHFLSE